MQALEKGGAQSQRIRVNLFFFRWSSVKRRETNGAVAKDWWCDWIGIDIGVKYACVCVCVYACVRLCSILFQEIDAPACVYVCAVLNGCTFHFPSHKFAVNHNGSYAFHLSSFLSFFPYFITLFCNLDLICGIISTGCGAS